MQQNKKTKPALSDTKAHIFPQKTASLKTVFTHLINIHYTTGSGDTALNETLGPGRQDAHRPRRLGNYEAHTGCQSIQGILGNELWCK